jgi:hypothetical protein
MQPDGDGDTTGIDQFDDDTGTDGETDDDTRSETRSTEESSEDVPAEEGDDAAQPREVGGPYEPSELRMPVESEWSREPLELKDPSMIKTRERIVTDAAEKPSSDYSRSGQETREPVADGDELRLERAEAAMRAEDILTNEKITESIEKVKDDLDEDVSKKTTEEKIVIGIVSGITTLTIGMVAWALRGVSLLASLLISLPIWKSIDPLPILDVRRRKEKEKKKKATAEELATKERDEFIVDSFFDASEKKSKDHQNKGNPK